MEQRNLVAVERAIETMQKRIDEEITIDDMARAAMFSKFHFTRMFQRVTGISPGRFLSALRIHRAKQFLTSTQWSVADISQRVGYSSVGTFSTRFKRSVGLSPTTYRQRGGFSDRIGLPVDSAIRLPATVCGTVRSQSLAHTGPIYLGIFPGPIPEERPVSCAVLPGPGSFVLANVPEGKWHVLACGDALRRRADHSPEWDAVTTVGVAGPFTVTSGMIMTDVWMRPRRMTDPPILTALFGDGRRGADPTVQEQVIRRAA